MEKLFSECDWEGEKSCVAASEEEELTKGFGIKLIKCVCQLHQFLVTRECTLEASIQLLVPKWILETSREDNSERMEAIPETTVQPVSPQHLDR